MMDPFKISNTSDPFDVENLEEKKKTVDHWLNEVNYTDLNSGSYVPSGFSLVFMNMVKLINGEQGESHKTPVVHLKMLDKIVSPIHRIANLCHRGIAKTTLFFEYLIFFLAIFRELPGFGELDSMIYVSDSIDNGVKSARKNIEFRYYNSEFLQEWLPEAKFTDNYIEFTNKDGKVFGAKMFGAKTGIRGTKIFGKRPKLAVLDDLVSDEDARSKAAMLAIEDTVYKGIDYALDPTRRKIIFNGTPFNKKDILYQAVESGAWDVNVWPVCEKFPCTKEEFAGSWEDRFSYEYVLEQYNDSVKTGKMSAFLQELMLRISSEEERLVQDSEIRWYDRQAIIRNRGAFNFFITTDFATTDRQASDNSVISVWAYNSNCDWFWVDGVCGRMKMPDSINELFRLVSAYRPQSVGVEISGQQSAFIDWLMEQQLQRNVWFNFAMQKNRPGIKPVHSKLQRFNLVVPWFTQGKMYFPAQMKESAIMQQFISELSLATRSGLKGQDDCLDTISMLAEISAWAPSEEAPSVPTDDIFGEDPQDNRSTIDSYVV
jgi:predicted phage terminase large subunit-like protein